MKNRSSRFSVLSVNARSLKHKINELQEYVCALKSRPRVICVNESFANENVSDAQLAIEGYEMIARRDGTDTAGGRCRGLVIYAEEGLGAIKTKQGGGGCGGGCFGGS